MGRSQNIKINRNLKKTDSNPYEWLWGGKTSVEKVTADAVEMARKLELEVEPKRCDWINCCNLMIEFKQMRYHYLWMNKEVVSWAGSTASEDAVKIVDMPTKDLEYYINLVDQLSWHIC